MEKKDADKFANDLETVGGKDCQVVKSGLKYAVYSHTESIQGKKEEYKKEILTNFNDIKSFENYIRKVGKLPDVVTINGIIYTMDNYDEPGKEVSYGNKKHMKGLYVITENRYKSFKDARVEEFELVGYRNDMQYEESLQGKKEELTSPYDIQKFLKNNKNFVKNGEYSPQDISALSGWKLEDVKRLATNGYAKGLFNFKNGKYFFEESLQGKKEGLNVGDDVITPDGYGEVVEIFKTGYILVEFPSRKRQQYLKKDLKLARESLQGKKEEVSEDKEGKIIMVAKSRGGKHSLVLKEDDYLIRGVQGYSIINFQNNSARGHFDAGTDLEKAIEQFKQHIQDWNEINTSLSKLYIEEPKQEKMLTKLSKIKEANEPKLVDALKEPKESEEKQTLAKIWEEAKAKNEHPLNAINFFTTAAANQHYSDEEVQAFLKKNVWDKETKD
jgi:hypothetical protein